MPLYRAYVLDEHGHVVGAINFDCSDDAEARENVKQLRGHEIELWREVSGFECGNSEREPNP